MSYSAPPGRRPNAPMEAPTTPPATPCTPNYVPSVPGTKPGGVETASNSWLAEAHAANAKLATMSKQQDTRAAAKAQRYEDAERQMREFFRPGDWVLCRLMPARIGNDARPQTRRYCFPDVDLDWLFSRLDCHSFFGIHPRPGGREEWSDTGGLGKWIVTWDSEPCVQRLRCLAVDVDGAQLEEVRRRIEAAGLPHPTMIVATGGGCHIYWKLVEPLEFSDWRPAQLATLCQPGQAAIRRRPDENGEWGPARYIAPTPQQLCAKRVIRGVCRAIGGDAKATDLARLLRVAGTANPKYDPPRIARLSYLTDVAYAWSAFAPWATAEDREAPQAPTAKGTKSKAPPNLKKIAPRIKLYLVKCDPAISGCGGHDAAMRTIAAVVQGFDLTVTPPGDVVELLEQWNARCSPPWSDDELIHKICDAQVRPSVDRAGRPRPNGWLRRRSGGDGDWSY